MKETTRNFHRHKRPAGNRQRPTVNVLLRLVFLQALPLLVLTACVSPAERKHMEAMLTDYEQRNSQYDTLSIDSTRRLADFFSRHGDAHQRMRAYYLLGCAHETAGESPQALDMFYKSLEQADTTASDCDYKRLSRIHGQIMQIMMNQHAFDEALAENEIIHRCALQSEDTIMLLSNMGKKCNIYNLIGKKDDELALREHIISQYAKYGLMRQKTQSTGPILDLLIERKRFDEARKYIYEYEKNSGFFDSSGNLKLKNKSFYYLKGDFFLQTGQFDSAAYYFRKEIKEAGITNNLETGYWGLCHYFQKKHMPDSAVKYALLSREMNDSCYNELSTDYYQRLQASYNYSRVEKKAAMLETRNTRLLAAALLGLFILVTLLFIGYILLVKYRRKQEQVQKDVQEWREKYAELLQAKNEMDVLDNNNIEDFSSIMAERNEQIEQLEHRIQELQKRKQVASFYHTEEGLVDAPIVQLFKDSLSDKNIIIRFEQWHQLKLHVSQHLPSFLNALREYYPEMTDGEQRVCILLRLHFPLKDIASIEKISLQHLGVLRKRLLKKVFALEGSAKDFDKHILTMH